VQATWKTSRLHLAMSAPNSDRNMQQLVPIAPPGKACNGESGKELVVVDPAGKSSGGVKLREDEEDLEVKLRRIMECPCACQQHIRVLCWLWLW